MHIINDMLFNMHWGIYMKFSRLLIFINLLMLVGLSGCGGGGSSGAGNSNDDGSGSGIITPSVPISDIDPDNVPADRQDEWDDYVEETQGISEAQIIGLYDVTFVDNGKTDIGYLAIQKDDVGQLLATAYNYMQDDFSNEGACYRLSANDDINAIFNQNGGTVLKWIKPWNSKDNSSHYVASLGQKGIKVKWLMDEDRNVTSLEYLGMSAGLSVRIRSGEVNAYIVREKMYDGSVVLEKILSNMCKGSTIDDSVSLKKNFAGVYNAVTSDELGYTYESYLHISEGGELKAYKYMGDGYDSLSNMNCFVKSYGYNANLDSQRLLFDSTTNRLFLNLLQDTYYWHLDQNGNVVSVSINNEESELSLVNHQEFISISSIKEDGVTKEYIESMICE